jgi:hypothetical protein
MLTDDLTRRALLRSVASFIVVVVVGSTAVYSFGRLGATPAPVATSPSPTDEPTTEPTPPGPVTPEAWLAWVPGGLPEDFGASLTTVPVVISSTTATADIAWMTASTDASGAPVDEPTEPYMIPLDVTGVEPARFAAFVPQPERQLVESLQQNQGILSESAAAVRGLGEGATLTFQTGATVTIAGTLPDVLMGGYELLVRRAAGEQLGVTHERYALFQVRPTASPDPVGLAALFLPLLPLEAPYPYVEVRAPGDTRYLRANDRELPAALLKILFGEFAARPDLATEGAIEIDPTWIQANVASQTLPVLGTVSCHEKALLPLKRAMIALQKQEDEGLVQSSGDCFEPVIVPDEVTGSLTARAFGAAIDLNPVGNRPGDDPTQPEPLVKTMFRFGYGWGGKDAYAQGSLFRYRRPPAPAGM